VDDSPALLAALARMLEPEHDVVQAASGAEGLHRLSDAGPFDVVISDEEMPGLQGTEFLSEVHRRAPATVGILLTGMADVSLAIRALHTGHVLRFLEKPCSQEALLAAVQDCVREHRRLLREREREGEGESARGALWEFNAALTSRIREQTQALFRLNRFLGDLNSAESLSQIAALAVDTLAAVLPERAVRIDLGSSLADLSASARVGGEFQGDRHVEEVVGSHGTVGLIVADTSCKGHRGFSRVQREALHAVASAIAVASHNVLRRVERDEAQQATIVALARLAEQRDNETGKHLERVSLYCRLIAEGLREDGQCTEQISDAWIDDLVRSAPLHDIGKVGIPDAILLKPAKLSPEEWAIMKRHTEIGARTLREVIREGSEQEFLRMSLEIAWCHHEKWDGSGYPRGLRGEDIPLCARILALADVYDALTTVRPYKDAWSHARAVEWVRQGAGEHFDPRVAQAFLSRHERADFIRARLADTAEDLVGWMRAIARAG
jgi:response regulator RpfG family c-di-GMP phosphodiesterase